MADEAKNQTSQQKQQQQSMIGQQIVTMQHHLTDSSGQVSLTIRLLMLGKEVGGIIGKKGDNIKRFREESGAKINITDGSCPERIVTLFGSVHEVFKAFTMICRKCEEGNKGLLSGNQASSGTTSAGIESGSILGNANPFSPSLDQSVSSMFGLSSNTGLLTNSLTKTENALAKDSDMLTLNNNNTSTINNNNNISANVTIKEHQASNISSNTAPLVTLRLIIPASQCGSLIGRGGGKIKEIREMTGATIQVAADVLPNSTERVVTITGNVESLTRCAYQICNIMIESPPKGYTVPYRPKPAMNQMLFANAASAAQAAAYNLPGQYALSAHPDINRLFVAAGNPLASALNPAAVNLRAAATNQATAAALSALGSQTITSSHEMVIPNGLIGCVIGKGGSKINEIRQLSGATIKISNSEEGTKNRTVTINGTPEAINFAQYLITASISTAVLANG